MIMKKLRIFAECMLLLLFSQLSAQTIVKMDMPTQADHPLEVVALFDEEIPEGIPVVLGLMGYDVAGGLTPYSYEWILNDEVISTNDIAIFTPQTGDNLVLTITDQNICSASTTFDLKIASVPGTNSDHSEDIRIYPTLVQNELFIGYPSASAAESNVRIFDVSGKLVFETHLQSSSKIFPGLKTGIYFVSVKMNDKHKVEKITAF